MARRKLPTIPPVPPKLAAELRRLADSPEMRRQAEQIKRLQESPVIKEVLERSRQVGEWLDKLEAPAPPPGKVKRKRKSGAGRPRELTPAEIEQGRQIVREDRRKNPKRWKTGEAAMARLHELFEPKRAVSDKTLLRHVILPVLGQNKPRR
jgi:hypothetical protein